jgi:hypothetical protein
MDDGQSMSSGRRSSENKSEARPPSPPKPARTPSKTFGATAHKGGENYEMVCKVQEDHTIVCKGFNEKFVKDNIFDFKKFV